MIMVLVMMELRVGGDGGVVVVKGCVRRWGVRLWLQ